MLKSIGRLGRVGLIEGRLSLKPYWGELNVRNFREGAGNVGYGRTRNPLRNRKSDDRKLPAKVVRACALLDLQPLLPFWTG